MVETKMHKVDVDETCLVADKYVHQVNDELTDCQDGNKVLQVKDMAMNVHSVALLIGGASNVEAAVTPPQKGKVIYTSPPPRHGGARRRGTMQLMFKLDLEKSKPSLETCFKENGKTQTLPTLMSSTHAFMHPQTENVRSQAHFP
jgi:hypothetical protein